MALVGVHPADQHQHPMPADGHGQQLTRMADRARRCESGQFGLGQHDVRRAQRRDGGRPSRAENDGDVVLDDAGALTDDLRRAPGEFGGIGRGFGHRRGA